MVSSSQNELFDPFRKRWVATTPEERVRQALLKQMVDHLGYPKSALAVEKGVKGFTKRRLDIICYTKNGKPLLLVECKAHVLGADVENQVLGYNSSIKAPYVCVAAQDGVMTGAYDGSEWKFFDGLPTYPSLLKGIQCSKTM